MKYFLQSFFTTLVILFLAAFIFFNFVPTGQDIWNTLFLEPIKESQVQKQPKYVKQLEEVTDSKELESVELPKKPEELKQPQKIYSVMDRLFIILDEQLDTPQ